MFVIKATPRDLGIKLGTLRKEGEIPAVFYGMGKETASITIPTVLFKKAWREAGESSPVAISLLEGDSQREINVLIHEVQVDPITSEPIHVDFLAIDMKKKVTVSVPLEFEGVSPAVKSGIGNLVKVLHEVEVEGLPSDLPQNIVVDISALSTLEDQVFVSNIKLPAGVAMITDPDEVAAAIVAQVEEKEEAIVDLSSIEVEKKGKKEEEGADSDTPIKE